MRLVVVSVDPARYAKMVAHYGDVELFEGVSGCPEKVRHDRCTPQTYRNLALHAVKEGWGLETVVIQDDVLVTNFDQGEGDFVIYGRTAYAKVNGKPGGKLHVCPKAFRASPEIWLRLTEYWNGKERICSSWMPVVDLYGQVLDVTAPIDG